MKVFSASNWAGWDRHGRLRKVKKFEAENVSPREAAAAVLQQMQAGRSRTAQIMVMEYEIQGTSRVMSIGLGGGGSRTWTIPATAEAIATLPEA